MSETVSDFLIRRIREWGITRIYGYPGDGINGIQMAHHFARLDVTWFEEPVSSDDLEGLRLIRDLAPAGMEVAAGEYGFDIILFPAPDRCRGC